MDRYWLLTWTTYGTWLPGDPRGFVSRVPSVDPDAPRIKHNQPGTSFDCDMPELCRSARQQMLGAPIRLTKVQAWIVRDDLCESAVFREWRMFAVAVMANHVHVVVGVPGDPDPAKLLQVFKSYASRRLNRQFGKPIPGTWWTASGSRRKLPHEDAVRAAVAYVRDQEFPLATWTIDPELL
jgi:REP element-mobilizing transposase RayT